MSEAHSLADWIAHVFDHPVTDPAWHWSPDAPFWRIAGSASATFIAEAFKRSGELLARFTDEQLDQGFWYLMLDADFMDALIEPEVPLALRLRALQSFVPLFEQVMAVRCSPHLSHLDEPGANPLNSSCYMWWDILPIHVRAEWPDRAEFDSAVSLVLRKLLTIPHDACRESALHGVGEWARNYPSVASVANLVDEFLSRESGLRPDLVSYAKRAKVGDVL